MKKYITDKEIATLLGYKNHKSYLYSKNNRVNTEKLLEEVIRRVEDKYKYMLAELKEDLIKHIKSLN